MEEEYLKCPFCDSIVEETITLPCTHEVCHMCIEATKGQPCPLSEHCSARPLTQEGESIGETLTRKRQQLGDIDAQLLAADLRFSLQLDKITEQYHEKVKKANLKHDQLVESERDAILKPINKNSRLIPSYVKRSGFVSEIYCDRLGSDNFLDWYLQPLGKPTSMRRYCGYGRFDTNEAKTVDFSPSDWAKIKCEPFDVYAQNKYFYVVKNNVVLRYSWKLDEFEAQKRIKPLALERRDEIRTKDWIVEPRSFVVLHDYPGMRAICDGPCHKMYPGDCLQSSHIAEWTIEGYSPDTTVLERALTNAKKLLDKKEKIIRAEAAKVEGELVSQQKCLETEIDTLENQLDVVAQECQPAAKQVKQLCFNYDPSALKTFKNIQDSVSLSSIQANEWIGATEPRKKVLFMPITHNRMLITHFRRTMLVEFKGDLFSGEIHCGRLAYKIADDEIDWAIACGDTLWVGYATGQSGGRKGKRRIKAFSLDRIGEKSDKPIPDVIFDDKLGKAEYASGKTAFVKNGTAQLGVDYFVADYAPIRTRVWFTRTVGNCIRALGSIVY